MSRWIFKRSSRGSNAGTETSMPLVNVIVNNSLFHSNSHISQIPPQIIHVLFFFLYTRCTRFCNEIYWGQGCSLVRNLEVHTCLVHYCTLGLEAANDAQNVRVDTARGKDNDQQNLSKMIMWYHNDIAAYITKSLQMSEDNNPVYKLMMHIMQLLLVNVIVSSIFLNTKVFTR